MRFAMRAIYRSCLAAGIFALLAAQPVLANPKNCRTFLSQKQYEAAGGKLIMTTPPDLSHFPRGFFCKTCFGAGGFETFVAEDGSVASPNWEHLAIFDHSKSGFSKDALWRPTVVSERIQAIRYKAPKVAGKPVCVGLKFNWTISSPSKLFRYD
jgi:hypothetical protein